VRQRIEALRVKQHEQALGECDKEELRVLLASLASPAKRAS